MSEEDEDIGDGLACGQMRRRDRVDDVGDAVRMRDRIVGAIL